MNTLIIKVKLRIFSYLGIFHPDYINQVKKSNNQNENDFI